MKDCFLYKHIRVDKEEIFYIGVGKVYKKDKLSSDPLIFYRRAYSKRNRNTIWKNIVSKTKYRIEIIQESEDYNFILSREKELIKLYGRIDKKTGILSNMTDGGEGIIGRVWTEESRKKASLSKKGKPLNRGFDHTGDKLSPEHRSKISLKLKGRFAGKNSWKYGKSITTEHKEKLRLGMKGKRMSEESRQKLSKNRKGVGTKKVKFIDDNIVTTFDSLTEASIKSKIPISSLSKIIRGERTSFKGSWEYIN